jgi:succinylarginine dihydrolase
VVTFDLKQSMRNGGGPAPAAALPMTETTGAR